MASQKPGADDESLASPVARIQLTPAYRVEGPVDWKSRGPWIMGQGTWGQRIGQGWDGHGRGWARENLLVGGGG